RDSDATRYDWRDEVSRQIAMCDFFFFQAEDGIRDWSVTGVQTCALPIYTLATVQSIATQSLHGAKSLDQAGGDFEGRLLALAREIGRASCRERGKSWGGAATL